MKRTNRVVSQSHFNMARFFAMGTSFVSIATGLFFMLANPQFSDTKRDLQLYEGGVSKDLIEIEPDKRSRNIGMIMILFGLVSGGLGVALSGDDEMDHPTQVKALSPVTSSNKNTAAIVPQQVDNVAMILKEKLMAMPWLASCITAPSLVIVGGTGSGKSRLAMCIGLFQCIIQRGTLRVGDLDAYQNISRAAWIAGSVYGEKPANAPALPDITSEQVSQLKELIGIAYGGQRSENSEWETYIWDELIKWQGDEYLATQLQALMSFGVATTRKRNQGFIYLAHGLEKGMFGGETNASGVLSNLLEVSPVIYLPTRKDMWGKSLKEDYFFYKPAGKRLGKTEEPPTKASHRGWELLSFPTELDPSKVGEVLRPLFNHLGLSLEVPSDRLGQVNAAKQQEFSEALIDRFPQFADIEEMVNTPSDNVSLLNKLVTMETVQQNVKVSDLSELALRLYQASNGKYSTGEHDINIVFKNWSKQGGFTGKGGKQNFLTFIKNASGIQVTGDKFKFNVIKEN